MNNQLRQTSEYYARENMQTSAKRENGGRIGFDLAAIKGGDYTLTGHF